MTTDRVTATYALRFPDGLRQRLKDTARDTRRSMHSEILTRLSGTYSGQIDQSVYSSLTSRLAEKTLLRLPRDLHAQLKSAAEANGRSLNAECVWRLLASYASPPSPAPAESGAVAWPGRKFCETAERNVAELAKWVKGDDDKQVASDAALAIRTLLASPSPSASMGRVTDAMVEAALLGVVPGGAHVWVWLPAGTEKANRTAREVMRAALEAALDYHEPAPGDTQPALPSTAETQAPPDHGGGEGWVLVPREPTEAMINAWWNSEGPDAARFAAMLAAAPTQESEDGR